MEQYIHSSVAARAVEKFFDTLRKQGSTPHTLQVWQNGEKLIRIGIAPYSCEDKAEVYSLSKSFCSTAVGLCFDRGLVRPDDSIAAFFADELPENMEDGYLTMEVGHVLSMRTGHAGCVFEKMWSSGNPVRTFFSQPLINEPGSTFCYNTGATYLLSALVYKLTGKQPLDLLEEEVFPTLGISGVTWATTAGYNEGGCGIHVSSDDIIKFGTLYLNRGVYNGKRLLSEEWAVNATSWQADNSMNGTPDWQSGYGYQFWMNARGGFRGDGARGQLCVVIPDEKTVAAVTGTVRDMQFEMDCLFKLLERLYQADYKAETAVIEPYAPVTASLGKFFYSGREYRLRDNPLHISSFVLRKTADGVSFSFTADGETQEINAWEGKWCFNTWTGRCMTPRLGIQNRALVTTLRGACCCSEHKGDVEIFIRMLHCPAEVTLRFHCNRDHAQIFISSSYEDGLLPDCTYLSD